MKTERVPEKHFWRRAGAFVIDWTIISIAALVLTPLIETLSPIKPVAPNVLSYRTCTSGPGTIKKVDADRLVPLQPGERRLGRFCEISQFGVLRQYLQIVGAMRQDGSATYTRALHINVDAEGNPIKVLPLSALMAIMAPLVFAMFLSHRRQTPGKSAMKLYVVGPEAEAPSFKSAIVRETLKLLPFVVYSAWWIYVELSFDLEKAAQLLSRLDSATESILFWALISAVLGAFSLVYWFFPFLRWRGQTFYDRWVGLFVHRVKLSTELQS